MLTKKQIVTLFSNARELARLDRPREARSNLLMILESAAESRRKAPTILKRAKLELFLDHWIAVSRDLYSNGVTDFVRESFGLPKAEETPRAEIPSAPFPISSLPAPEPEPIPAPTETEGNAPAPYEAEEGSDIDISGLIEEVKETQGLCAEVFEKNKSAVAEIYVTGNGKAASGTGFVISEKGYLLTNDHVVFDVENGAYYPKISMKLGGKRCRLDVLFSDKKTDIALCAFDPDEAAGSTCVKRFADYSLLQQGADCILIGNGFGMGLAPFSGEVRYTRDGDGNLVHTAPSNPGDSGAPVFNRKGECIGINKSKTVRVNEEAADGIANATPMDTVEALLAKWCRHNDIEL